MVEKQQFEVSSVSSSLEYKLFRMATLIGLLTTFLIVFYDLFVTGDRFALSIEAATMIGFGIIHVLGRNPQRMDMLKRIFLIILGLILNLAYVFTGGLGDGFTNLIMLSATVTLILTPRMYWRWVISAIVLNVVIMMVVEHLVPGIRRIPGPDDRLKILITTDVFLTISLLIGLLIFGIMKTHYDELRSLAVEQNSRLLQINDEIASKNEALFRKNRASQELNETLEKKVAARTAEIEAYQKRLMEIAFFNSHRMRRPLANILGILDILPEENQVKEGDENWTRLLKEEAQKLDEQIQEVQEVLNSKTRN